jgi:hypothetical protein
MRFRQTETIAVGAAKASFCAATAYGNEHVPRLPSAKAEPRSRRRPDPLSAILSRRSCRCWRRRLIFGLPGPRREGEEPKPMMHGRDRP